VDGVTALGLDALASYVVMRICVIITRANRNRGRKRKYDSKVDLTDISRMSLVSEIEPQLLPLYGWGLGCKYETQSPSCLHSRLP
jgi:hypothetical protein